MSKQTYVQCRMERKTPSGNASTTSWIPAKFAKLDWILDLKDGVTWTRGWIVKLVGSRTADPPDWRKLIKGHRKMTGDSLPRKD